MHSKAKMLDLLRCVVTHLAPKVPASFDVESDLILSNGKTYSPAFRVHDGRLIMSSLMDENGVYFLYGDGVKSRSEFMRECRLDPVIGSRISERYLAGACDRLFQKCREQDETPNAQVIRKFLNELRDAQRNCVLYFPLDNLYLSAIKTLEIGGVVFLRTGEALKEIRKMSSETFDRHGYDAKSKRKWGKYYRTMTDERLLNHPTCAKVQITAEEGIAEELALERLEKALNLLRCFTPYRYQRGMRAQIGLGGEVTRYGRKSICFTGDTFHHHEKLVGYRFGYNLDKVFWEFIKKECNFTRLREIFDANRTDLSEIEQRIVTAAQWIGSGIHESEVIAFLHQCIALESLLNFATTEATSHNIALRVAFLIGGNRTRYTYNEAKRLYDLRSRIAHVGNLEVDAKDLALMQNMALACFMEVVRRSQTWRRGTQLTTWADEQFLGSLDARKSVRGDKR